MPETTQKPTKNTGMAVVAYILFFIPLLTDAKKDPFVKYHVKQGLALFLSCIAIWILGSIMAFLPIIGWFFITILDVLLLVLFIIGIMNAIKGEEKPLPVIGKLGEKFKF